MTFWIVSAVVVVVLFALAWWSSGRARRDFAGDLNTRIGKSQGEVGMQAGRHTGGQFHPGVGPGGSV